MPITDHVFWGKTSDVSALRRQGAVPAALRRRQGRPCRRQRAHLRRQPHPGRGPQLQLPIGDTVAPRRSRPSWRKTSQRQDDEPGPCLPAHNASPGARRTGRVAYRGRERRRAQHQACKQADSARCQGVAGWTPPGGARPNFSELSERFPRSGNTYFVRPIHPDLRDWRKRIRVPVNALVLSWHSYLQGLEDLLLSEERTASGAARMPEELRCALARRA